MKDKTSIEEVEEILNGERMGEVDIASDGKVTASSLPKGAHPSTRHVMQFFRSDHLPDHLRDIARECERLAMSMATNLSDGPEKTVGLRKLLEAKDCFVRARLAEKG